MALIGALVLVIGIVTSSGGNDELAPGRSAAEERANGERGRGEGEPRASDEPGGRGRGRCRSPASDADPARGAALNRQGYALLQAGDAEAGGAGAATRR